MDCVSQKVGRKLLLTEQLIQDTQDTYDFKDYLAFIEKEFNGSCRLKLKKIVFKVDEC